MERRTTICINSIDYERFNSLKQMSDRTVFATLINYGCVCVHLKTIDHIKITHHFSPPSLYVSSQMTTVPWCLSIHDWFDSMLSSVILVMRFSLKLKSLFKARINLLNYKNQKPRETNYSIDWAVGSISVLHRSTRTARSEAPDSFLWFSKCPFSWPDWNSTANWCWLRSYSHCTYGKFPLTWARNPWNSFAYNWMRSPVQLRHSTSNGRRCRCRAFAFHRWKRDSTNETGSTHHDYMWAPSDSPLSLQRFPLPNICSTRNSIRSRCRIWLPYNRHAHANVSECWGERRWKLISRLAISEFIQIKVTNGNYCCRPSIAWTSFGSYSRIARSRNGMHAERSVNGIPSFRIPSDGMSSVCRKCSQSNGANISETAGWFVLIQSDNRRSAAYGMRPFTLSLS